MTEQMITTWKFLKNLNRSTINPKLKALQKQHLQYINKAA